MSRFSFRPPQSAASTSSTSYNGQPASPSFPTTSLDASEVSDMSIPDDLSVSEEDDADARDTDSLFDAQFDEVAERATGFLFEDYVVQDKEDLFKTKLFNRPPPGTEIDKDIAKQMQPRLRNALDELDRSDWMYPTPHTFQPVHRANTDIPSVDLPIYAHNTATPWQDSALNLQAGPTFESLLEMDHPNLLRATWQTSEAERELELSFVEGSIAGQNTYGLANGQLARDVSLLGLVT